MNDLVLIESQIQDLNQNIENITFLATSLEESHIDKELDITDIPSENIVFEYKNFYDQAIEMYMNKNYAKSLDYFKTLVEKNNKGAQNLVYPYDILPQPGRMLKLADGVYWVRMNLPFALNHINLWVLEDGDGWTIIDTGVASAEIKSNWRTCFSGDMKSLNVKKIIVTHLHPDHIGLAGWLNRKFSSPLFMSRSEYLMCRMLVSDTGREAPEEGKSLYRSAGFTEDELDSYAERFGGFGSAISKLPDRYNRLKDYDKIQIGNYVWEIVVGSGLCAEHICLYNED